MGENSRFYDGKSGDFLSSDDTPAREKIFPKILKNTRETGIIQRFGDDDKYGGDYTRGRTMNCFEALEKLERKETKPQDFVGTEQSVPENNKIDKLSLCAGVYQEPREEQRGAPFDLFCSLFLESWRKRLTSDERGGFERDLTPRRCTVQLDYGSSLRMKAVKERGPSGGPTTRWLWVFGELP